MIVAATAAPAMAASGPGTFALSAGTSFVSTTEYYKAIIFQGFTIVPSLAIPAGTLRLTITFSGIRFFLATTNLWVDAGVPTGWSRLTAGTPDFASPTALYQRAAASAAGESVSFPNNTRGGLSGGYYVDANGASSGTFTLTASATGFTSSAITLAVPASRGTIGAEPRLSF